MNVNEAKQAAYSASNRAKGKCEELLKTQVHTKQDGLELADMAAILTKASRRLIDLAPSQPKAATPGE